MNDPVILYPNDDGGVAVVIPAPSVSFAEVLATSVPAGKPYRIVERSDLPADRTYRDAWEADFSSPDGIGGQS